MLLFAVEFEGRHVHNMFVSVRGGHVLSFVVLALQMHLLSILISVVDDLGKAESIGTLEVALILVIYGLLTVRGRDCAVV